MLGMVLKPNSLCRWSTFTTSVYASALCQHWTLSLKAYLRRLLLSIYTFFLYFRKKKTVGIYWATAMPKVEGIASQQQSLACREGKPSGAGCMDAFSKKEKCHGKPSKKVGGPDQILGLPAIPGEGCCLTSSRCQGSSKSTPQTLTTYNFKRTIHVHTITRNQLDSIFLILEARAILTQRPCLTKLKIILHINSILCMFLLSFKNTHVLASEARVQQQRL